MFFWQITMYKNNNEIDKQWSSSRATHATMKKKTHRQITPINTHTTHAMQVWICQLISLPLLCCACTLQHFISFWVNSNSYFTIACNVLILAIPSVYRWYELSPSWAVVPFFFSTRGEWKRHSSLISRHIWF